MELKLIHVNKFYKLSNKENFQALYDVNVEFDKGELVSIVGESGSGKSTLMNLIGGLDSDFSGGIIAGGQNLSKLTDKELDKYRKNHVGFVFQSFNLISHLSILDNVTLALTLSNVSEKEKVERATTILKRVGLADQLKKKPTQLSGGQKQRVAIARALINDPEIIIADEPTGALDSGTSMQILEILKEIADSGKLVIMVTHSEKVASVSSRVVEISDGKIIGDRKNENYVKNAPKEDVKKEQESPQEEVSIDQKFAQKTAEKAEDKKTKRNFRNFKDKQNLSLWQAIRLSFHNMWASKTKNILMSIGVAIGIGSLILMMCFSSGITDFIDDTMKSYSDPTIVTIKKSAQNITDMMQFKPFTDREIEVLMNGNVNDVQDGETELMGLNAYLKEKGFNFTVTDGKQVDGTIDKNQATLTRGLQVMAALFDGKVLFDPENTWTKDNALIDEPDLKKITESGGAYDGIIYLYTIPPFYSKNNVSEGEMATSKGGVMFTAGVKQMFEKAETKTEVIGSEVKIYLKIPPTAENPKGIPLTFSDYSTGSTREKIKITGIMDTSVMAGFNVMYIDYDFLQQLFKEKGAEEYFGSNALYIQTGNEKIVAAINEYLNTYYKDQFTGSIEEQLAGMFRSMTSVIGTSLIVISLISLLVSAMMILVVLYMSVTERTKEIGVLKSIGARRKDIRRIFTSESFLVGVLSGIFGIIFNLILTLVVVLTLNSTIGLAPITYRWWYFAVGMGVAIFISMLSGLYPANKASKLDPVESLRRE